MRVDPATNRVAATVALPSASPTYGVTGIVAARGLVWVAYPGRGLVRVDPGAGKAREVRAGGRLVAVDRLAFAGGWLWAAKDRLLHRVHLRDGTVTATVGGPTCAECCRRPHWPAEAGGSDCTASGRPASSCSASTRPPGGVEAVSTLGGGTGGQNVQVDLGASDRVVAVRSGSRLLLADPDQGMVRATMPAPGTRAAGMAVDGGLIWLSDPARGRLLRIGPALLGNP